MTRDSNAPSSWERLMREREREAAEDAATLARLEQDRESRRYCPELPPGPVYRPPVPTYDEDPELWREAERTFGHWPAPVADIDDAVDDALRRLRR